MREKKLVLTIDYKIVYTMWLDCQISSIRQDLDYETAKDVVEGRIRKPTIPHVCSWYSEITQDTELYSGIIIKQGKRTIYKKTWKLLI